MNAFRFNPNVCQMSFNYLLVCRGTCSLCILFCTYISWQHLWSFEIWKAMIFIKTITSDMLLYKSQNEDGRNNFVVPIYEQYESCSCSQPFINYTIIDFFEIIEYCTKHKSNAIYRTVFLYFSSGVLSYMYFCMGQHVTRLYIFYCWY